MIDKICSLYIHLLRVCIVKEKPILRKVFSRNHFDDFLRSNGGNDPRSRVELYPLLETLLEFAHECVKVLRVSQSLLVLFERFNLGHHIKHVFQRLSLL